MVKMPTPEAVLEATRLLARGAEAEPGLGDLMVIDIGGATTDVHSDHAHEVAAPGIEEPLLPPPPTLRTVEGDLGLRSGAAGVFAADRRWIEAELEIDEAAIGQAVSRRSGNPEWIPAEPIEARLDALLAVGCATHAVTRHSGTMLLTRSEAGPPTLVREGPDLREVRRVFGTGGVFAHREDGEWILRGGPPASRSALAGAPGSRPRDRRQLHPRRRRSAGHAGSRRRPAADAAGAPPVSEG